MVERSAIITGQIGREGSRPLEGDLSLSYG